MNARDRASVQEHTQQLCDSGFVFPADRLYAIPIDVTVIRNEQEIAKEVEAPAYGKWGVVTHFKGGTIVLLWDEWVDVADHSKGAIVRERTIVVSKRRAEQAMTHLEQEGDYI